MFGFEKCKISFQKKYKNYALIKRQFLYYVHCVSHIINNAIYQEVSVTDSGAVPCTEYL